MNTGMRDVIVVGAGVTGLACARKLRKEGLSVLLVDRSDEVGGVVRSEELPGAGRIDHGPQTLRSADPDLIQEFRELGIEEDRLVSGEGSRNRYVFWDGRMIALPMGPMSFLTSPVLPLKGKVRLLTEPFRKTHGDGDVSVADFFRGRLGPAVLNRLVDPFVSGVYAGDPEHLSMEAVFPSLKAGVDEHGSLLRWGLAAAKKAKQARRESGEPRRKPELFSFREGLGQWPRAVRRELGEASVQLGVELDRVASNEEGWTVEGSLKGDRWSARAREVVLAVPAGATAGLLRETFAAGVRRLADIPYAPVATVHLAFPREAVAHPMDGFGCLFPSSQGRAALGILWISSLFPDRVEDGRVLTTTFVGGAQRPEFALREESWILKKALAEHREILGVSVEPVASKVVRWTTAIPQYEFGHLHRVEAATEMEAAAPGLHLAGSWRGGVSVPDCWKSGRALADRIVVRRRSERPSSPVAERS